MVTALPAVMEGMMSLEALLSHATEYEGPVVQCIEWRGHFYEVRVERLQQMTMAEYMERRVIDAADA